MIKRILSPVAFVACLAMASSAFAYSIGGRVTCLGDGSPLPGIEVTASQDGYTSSATTDASGAYVIGTYPSPQLNAGVWDMSLDTPYPVVGPAQVDLGINSFPTNVDYTVDDPACGSSPFCGDGNVDPGEECDDGNTFDGDGCSSSCEVETFCGDGVLDPEEQCDDGNTFDGDGCSGECTIEFGGEGCTPGYWRQPQHFDSYADTGYAPNTLFVTAFGVDAFPGLTLSQVVALGGGGLNALGRHAVAALLNAASPDVDYDRTPAQVIAAFTAAYASGDYEATKDLFEGLNEQSCPLN